MGVVDSIAQYCIHYREYWLYHGKDWLGCFFLSLDSGLRDDLLFMNCTRAFSSLFGFEDIVTSLSIHTRLRYLGIMMYQCQIKTIVVSLLM